MSSERATWRTTRMCFSENAGASNTGTMPYPRDSTAPDHSWEIEARLSMCRISFLTFSISHMSIGAMRPVPTRWYSAEICRATVFIAWWVRQQRLVAVFTMNRPDEERNAAPQWIESAQRVSASKLADVSQAIATASVSPAV